jgi:hypothetical protein
MQPGLARIAVGRATEYAFVPHDRLRRVQVLHPVVYSPVQSVLIGTLCSSVGCPVAIDGAYRPLT